MTYCQAQVAGTWVENRTSKGKTNVPGRPEQEEECDAQVGVGADLGRHDTGRALGRQHEVHAQAPAPLGDVDERRCCTIRKRDDDPPPVGRWLRRWMQGREYTFVTR